MSHNLIKWKFSLGKISDIIYLGKSIFGRFSSEIPRDRYISPEIFSCNPTLVFVAQNYPRAGPSCNFLATNTRVSGLLEKISGNISVPWYIIYENFQNCLSMNCQRNVNFILRTQLPHKFSYIVAILIRHHFESPNTSFLKQKVRQNGL
jgi:hypothetical protein